MPNPFSEYLAKSADQPVLLCMGCRELGRCRLGMIEYRRVSEGRCAGRLMCPPEFQGAPKTAHGGWIAAIMDEVLGFLPLRHGAFAVTKTITVDYRKPLPIERALACAAVVESREGGQWIITGEITLDGVVLTTGRGTFIERDMSHFQRFERWMEEQKK
jgi:acyl-coenzyme A thioesterase PaaI-like protein